LSQRIASALRFYEPIGPTNGMVPYILIVFASAATRAVRFAFAPIQRLADLDFETLLGTALLGYWLYVGGDISDDRVLLVVVPLGISILFRALASVENRRAAAAVVLAVFLFHLVPIAFDGRYTYTTTKYDPMMNVGAFLARKYPNAYIAVDAAGKLPFFSE